MDMQGLQCHGCGSENVEFDPKNRILQCHQCGKSEYYSRATLNANGKVAFGQRNAIRFFSEGKLEDARHYAMDVLNIFMDNAPALYILAYYDEFTARKPDSIKQFFQKLDNVPLEGDEIQDMCGLFVASAYNLSDFEEAVLTLVATNMQSPADKAELCKFIDKLCPYLISKRTSSSFLTDSLVEIYQELAGHCGIPKTCFALLKSIQTNPDSPYVNNSFYLKAKVRYFEEHYVIPIGGIIRVMDEPNFRSKLLGAYEKLYAQYVADAKKA